MKKIIFAITLLFITIIPVFAVDFGGVVDNNTKLIFPGTTPEGEASKVFLDQRNSLTAWLRVPLNADGSFYFATEGFFQFKHLNGNPRDYSAEASNQYLIDLTLLKLGYVLKIDSKNTVSVSLGRFAVSDMSGLIFNQNSDGVMLKYDRRWIDFNFYAGYTGFLNSLNVRMVRHPKSTYQQQNTDWYDFATPYIIMDTSVSFPYFFLNQTFSTELIVAAGATGLNFGGNNEGNAGISRFFWTLALNGPIASKLFYIATTTFEFEEYGPANLSRFSLSYYPSFLSTSLTANFVYASGNNHSGFTSFSTITSNTAVHALEKREYTGLLKAGLAASIKPANFLYLSGGFDVIWACPDKQIGYDGIEWNATVKWQPFSDLAISAGATHFIGKESYAKTNDKFELLLKASLSF